MDANDFYRTLLITIGIFWTLMIVVAITVALLGIL